MRDKTKSIFRLLNPYFLNIKKKINNIKKQKKDYPKSSERMASKSKKY